MSSRRSRWTNEAASPWPASESWPAHRYIYHINVHIEALEISGNYSSKFCWHWGNELSYVHGQPKSPLILFGYPHLHSELQAMFQGSGSRKHESIMGYVIRLYLHSMHTHSTYLYHYVSRFRVSEELSKDQLTFNSPVSDTLLYSRHTVASSNYD